ncbi:MAG: hypothetical protein Fur0010_22070 [Bdellovibrio sp.]
MKINIPTEIVDSERLENIVSHHHLGGWLYSRSQDNPKFEIFKNDWMRQISLNQSQRQVWEQIIENWPNHLRKPIVLKGMAFELMGIYGPGERFKSDIDLLADEASIEFIISKLKSLYQVEIVKEKKWWGNSHKQTIELQCEGNSVIIEFHQQLFYHLPNVQWQHFKNSEQNYLLEDHAHLIYLMGHFVFQHNCLKLYWLLDIVLFLEKKKDWDLEKLKNIAKMWKLETAFEWSLSLAKEFCDQTFFDIKTTKQVNLSELWEGRQSGLAYWWRKHQAKDSLITAIAYDLKWIFK